MRIFTLTARVRGLRTLPMPFLLLPAIWTDIRFSGLKAYPKENSIQLLFNMAGLPEHMLN